MDLFGSIIVKIEENEKKKQAFQQVKIILLQINNLSKPIHAYVNFS